MSAIERDSQITQRRASVQPLTSLAVSSTRQVLPNLLISKHFETPSFTKNG